MPTFWICKDGRRDAAMARSTRGPDAVSSSGRGADTGVLQRRHASQRVNGTVPLLYQSLWNPLLIGLAAPPIHACSELTWRFQQARGRAPRKIQRRPYLGNAVPGRLSPD